MIQNETWNWIARIDLIFDKNSRRKKILRSIPRQQFNSILITIAQKFCESIDINIQSIDSCPTRMQIRFHNISEFYIILPRNSMNIEWIQIFRLPIKLKVDTAIARCNCSTSTFSHHEIWKPILHAAICRIDSKIWKFNPQQNHLQSFNKISSNNSAPAPPVLKR